MFAASTKPSQFLFTLFLALISIFALLPLSVSALPVPAPMALAQPASLLGRAYRANANTARASEVPTDQSNGALSPIILRAADTGSLINRAERFQLRMERARRFASDSEAAVL